MVNGSDAVFEQAVAYAVKKLSPLFVDGELKPGTRQPSELYLVIMLQLRGGRDEIGSFYVLTDEQDGILCNMAEWDRGAYDLYRRIIADRVDRYLPLSWKMRVFHWHLLHDRIKAPKPQTKKAKNFELSLKILTIARHLTENFPIPKMGNPTGPRVSVCDAISTAFGRLGHAKSSRAIQELLVNKSSDEIRKQAELLWEVEVAHPFDHPEEFAKFLEADGDPENKAIAEMFKLLRNARSW